MKRKPNFSTMTEDEIKKWKDDYNEWYRDYRKKNYEKLLNRYREYDATNPVRKITKYEYHDENIHTWDNAKYEWVKNNLELRREIARNWNKANRAKIAMKYQSKKLIKHGIINRTSCTCGSTDTIIYQYDATTPYGIKFLCKECARIERNAVRRRDRLNNILITTNKEV
jgi:hypothetical protein